MEVLPKLHLTSNNCVMALLKMLTYGLYAALISSDHALFLNVIWGFETTLTPANLFVGWVEARNPTGKLSEALETDLWEMFDFGHAVSAKELKELIQKFSQKADENTLRTIAKIIKVFER